MLLVIAILISFMITLVFLPVIIKVAKSVKLLDLPDRRKVHIEGTPSMGGIAIFIGFLMATIITLPLDDLVAHKYLISSLCLIFFVGIRDDVFSLPAQHKLLAQIFAATLIIAISEIRLTGLYNIAGINEIPYGLEYVLSVAVIVIMTNSFNLIDGIDGLAGSIGFIILMFFSWIFYVTNQLPFAIISFTASGSILAFLIYNWHPSKIFMGDTGSMTLGFLISTLAIKVINISIGLDINSFIQIESSVALVIACLIVPFYDTLRVFMIRLSQKKSPFNPDRNHIHHSLLNLGLSHARATLVLASYNIVIIILALLLSNTLANGILTLIIFSLTVVFGRVVDYLVSQRKLLNGVARLDPKKNMSISKSA